jgi:hypothetical protein
MGVTLRFGGINDLVGQDVPQGGIDRGATAQGELSGEAINTRECLARQRQTRADLVLPAS